MLSSVPVVRQPDFSFICVYDKYRFSNTFSPFLLVFSCKLEVPQAVVCCGTTGRRVLLFMFMIFIWQRHIIENNIFFLESEKIIHVIICLLIQSSRVGIQNPLFPFWCAIKGFSIPTLLMFHFQSTFFSPNQNVMSACVLSATGILESSWHTALHNSTVHIGIINYPFLTVED